MFYLRTALDYLDLTADRLPEKIAFSDGETAFTFDGLRQAACAAGTAIRRISGRLRSPVAILTDRTAISVAGYLGAMEAGCMAVPLDGKMPSDRLTEILRRISPAVIFCQAKNAKRAAEFEDIAPVLMLEDVIGGEIDAAELKDAREHVLDVDPAYMIFTSGSTGKPKGIPVSHRSLIDFTEWMAEACGVTESDVLGNQAPFFFDLSVKDLFQTIRNGATCHILPKKCFLFPKILIDTLRDSGVTCLIWATSAFRMTAESGILEADRPDTVKKIILGGEALQAKHLNRWKRAIPDCRFINLYGPTEVTVDCTIYEIDRDFEDGEPIPIGKACRNMEVLLLDDDGRPVPDGEPGEISVRGIGLALGYYGDAEKTKTSFVQNPLCPEWQDRLYKTGDIGRIGPDGNLYFLARRDDQIKHGGYRIELGEIETALSAIEGVAGAMCFFDEANDKIIAAVQTGLTPADLASEIKNKVPRYMVPNDWRILERLPLTPNGKIDRNLIKESYFNEQRVKN